MKKEEKRSQESSSTSGLNVWMIMTAVLGIAFIVILALYMTSGGSASSGAIVPAQTCGPQMVEFINKNLVQAGTTATFRSVEEKDGLYQVIFTYQGQDITIFASRDCSLLFLNYVDIKNVTPTPTITPTPTQTPVKLAVPMVDLYVMSFCPYGVQAENSIKPVVDLFGAKANFTVRYIASVNGNDINSVSSLHGLNEAKEDARQLCVMQYYPNKYWAYVMEINDQCYSIASNGTALETCWKKAATDFAMNVSQIESCAYGSEGITFLRGDEVKVNQYGVTGSPTLFINGQKYTGPRTTEAFKTAICNAFQTIPAECSANLTSNVTPATGSC